MLLAASFASCLPRTPILAAAGRARRRDRRRAAAAARPARRRDVPGLIRDRGRGALTGVGARRPLRNRRRAGLARRTNEARRTRDEAADEHDDEERASISLGWLTHGLLSLKARLARCSSAAPRTRTPRRAADAAPRRARAALRRLGSDAPRDSRPEDAEDEDEEDEAHRARRASRGRRHGAAPQVGGGYVLPPLELLGAPQSDRSARRSAPRRCRTTPPRSKACWATSACAARSSMRARARWSRSTSSSPRPASSRRA